MRRWNHELKTTNNRSVYNRLYKKRLAVDGDISCSYCGYHRGENMKHHSSYLRQVGSYERWWMANGRPRYANWKWLRKTQYKIRRA